MKTLADYIKGYPHVCVYLLCRYRDYNTGKKYSLCQEPGHNSYYFMYEEEVLDRDYIYADNLEKLCLKAVNKKDLQNTLALIEQSRAFKFFIRKLKEELGDSFNRDYVSFC